MSGGSDDRLLACRNGLLRLKDGLLLRHSADFFNTSATGFDYDPDAAEPVEWLKFLAAIWTDDPESIATGRTHARKFVFRTMSA
jgi:putative DNA primase/helicase